jgi:hypothetical protein
MTSSKLTLGTAIALAVGVACAVVAGVAMYHLLQVGGCFFHNGSFVVDNDIDACANHTSKVVDWAKLLVPTTIVTTVLSFFLDRGRMLPMCLLFAGIGGGALAAPIAGEPVPMATMTAYMIGGIFLGLGLLMGAFFAWMDFGSSKPSQPASYSIS